MDEDICILYVEDDPLSRQVMQMIADHVMHIRNLVLFESTQDLMARLQRLLRHPDLILLDVHVQPFNGFDVLRMLRAHPDFAQTRIVALTASVMNEEVEQLRACGFDGAIGKPLSVTTLPGLIERALRGEAVWHIT